MDIGHPKDFPRLRHCTYVVVKAHGTLTFLFLAHLRVVFQP